MFFFSFFFVFFINWQLVNCKEKKEDKKNGQKKVYIKKCKKIDRLKCKIKMSFECS